MYIFSSQDTKDDPAQFLFLRGDWNPHEEDPLCFICQQINFSYLVLSTQRHGLKLGSYADVKSRAARGCSFCDVVVNCSSVWTGTKHLTPGDQDVVRLQNKAEDSTASIQIQIVRGVTRGTELAIHTPVREVRLYLERRNSEGAVDMYIPASPEPEIETHVVNLRIGKKYDRRTVDEWLQSCRTASPPDAPKSGGPRGTRRSGFSDSSILDANASSKPPISRVHRIRKTSRR